MKNASKEKRRRKRRAMSQAMLIILLTIMSLATDGFGAAPPSQFSEDFREQLSEALPAELVEEINQYLTGVNTVHIPTQVVDAVGDVEPASSPSFFSENFLEFLSLVFPPEVFDTIYEITTPPFGFPDANNVPSQAESTLSPEEIAQTLVASFFTTGTPAAPPTADAQKTATALSSLTPSAIPTSTFTPSPTPTASPSPSPTIIWYPWTFTPTPKPPPINTPTNTPTPTPTWNFIISNVALNNVPGSAITVYSGQTVLLDYDYQVWTSSAGNLAQLLSGVSGTVNADSACGYNGAPGLSPGTTGSVNDRNLTAPTMPGTYNIEMGYDLQFICGDAVANYTNLTKKVIGTLTVIRPITIYRPNSYDGGSLGDRSNTKALCASALPSGYTNYQAFIGYSAADSIANMPSNYGVPTNLKIQSPNGTIIANNWADLLDGTIIISLRDAGIPASAWWSGAESADGTHIDGVTNNCVDWTDNNANGQLGSLFATDSQWMVSSISACSPQDWTLLCIAYP